MEAYILFEVDGTHYAVPSAQVQQVEMIETITRVPNAPEFVEGVVYLRGQVVPVINLRRRFGLPERPYNLRSRLVVVQAGSRVVGLAADSAREFVHIEPEKIKPPPEGFSVSTEKETTDGSSQDYLVGVVMLGERLVLVVDLPALLNPQEKRALETV